MKLFHVQDADRPMYVLANSWREAFNNWCAKVAEENDCSKGEVEDPDGVAWMADEDDILLRTVVGIAEIDWVPTANNINALPDSIRKYIHDLETRADPAGDIREIHLLRQQKAALEDELARLRSGDAEVDDYEKAARVYYQNIVYDVCGILDDLDGRRVSYGEGIVCGTVSSPSTEVQDRLKRLVEEFKSRWETSTPEPAIKATVYYTESARVRDELPTQYQYAALIDVIAERTKQRQKWGVDDDDRHVDKELAHVAGNLAIMHVKGDLPPKDTWGIADRNPDPRERLVIAAALLIAEIERLDRLEARPVCPAKPPREIVGKEFSWEDGRKVRVASWVFDADGNWFVQLLPDPHTVFRVSWSKFCEVVGAEAINQAVAASAATTTSARSPQSS